MATNDADVKTNAAEPREQSPAADAAGRKRDLALVSRGTYLKEKALQYLFFACAFLAVVTVVLIFAFTMMQAAPVFTDIGLANFFTPSFTWAPPGPLRHPVARGGHRARHGGRARAGRAARCGNGRVPDRDRLRPRARDDPAPPSTCSPASPRSFMASLAW